MEFDEAKTLGGTIKTGEKTYSKLAADTQLEVWTTLPDLPTTTSIAGEEGEEVAIK